MLKSLSVILRYWFSKQKDLIKNNQPYKSPIWYGCIIPWYIWLYYTLVYVGYGWYDYPTYMFDFLSLQLVLLKPQ
jgi:hypothetical protein